MTQMETKVLFTALNHILMNQKILISCLLRDLDKEYLQEIMEGIGTIQRMLDDFTSGSENPSFFDEKPGSIG